MSPYKIKATCADPLWRNIPVCEIGISPGNAAHEGDKLASILEWANQNFSHSILTLSDTMYRHNFMGMGHHENEALTLSQKLGDDWLAQNNDILSEYKDNIRLDRWVEWQQHPDFNLVYDDLMKYVSSSDALKQALNTDIQAFMARKIKQGQNIDFVKARFHSFNLITEEIACYILIGRSQKLARAYPSKDMHSFSFMRNPLTPTELKGFENITHIDLTLNRRHADTQRAA